MLIGHIKAEEGVIAAAKAQPEKLPIEWEVSLRNMTNTIMAVATEEMHQQILSEAIELRPQIDELLAGRTEAQKSLFIRDLGIAFQKAFMKKSRVPAYHRLSNALIKVYIDHMGKMPPKKAMSAEIVADMKAFAEKILGHCKQDRKCRRYL